MPIPAVSVRRRPRRGARLTLAAVLGAAVFGVSAGSAGAMDEPLECRIMLIVIDVHGQVEDVSFWPCSTGQRDGDVWRWDRATRSGTLVHRSASGPAMGNATAGQTASNGSGGTSSGSGATAGTTSTGGGCSSSPQNPAKRKPPIAVNQNTAGSCGGSGSSVI